MREKCGGSRRTKEASRIRGEMSTQGSEWEHSREGEFSLSPIGRPLKAQMSLTMLMLFFFFCSSLCWWYRRGACVVGSIFLAPPFWLVLSLAGWVWPAEWDPAVRQIWISFPDCCSFHPGCRCHTCARSLPTSTAGAVLILLPSCVFPTNSFMHVSACPDHRDYLLEYFLGQNLFSFMLAINAFWNISVC